MPYCKNCSKIFEVSAKEKDLYGGLGAKEPTHCFDCRMQRKYAFRNERKMYNRACDRCTQQMISSYPAGSAFPVYCSHCWWGDGWEATSYGRPFDFSRPLWQQLAELQNAVPRLALPNTDDNVNSPYITWTDRAKNCHLVFSSSNCEDCYYGEILIDARDCVDCTNVKESENCYFGIDLSHCYNVCYSRNLKNCLDCAFCFDCADCNNCFLSYNLRHRRYCIRNVQYSPEAYQEQVTKILRSRAAISAAWAEFTAMIRQDAIHKFANLVKSEDVTGDDLYACRRSYNSFDSREIQDCANVIYGDKIADCADCFAIVEHAERCVETFSVNGGYQARYGYGTWSNCRNMLYSNSCSACSDCFGCIGLRHKQYCILNVQYTPQDYHVLLEKITAHLQKTETPSLGGGASEWGEFYPVQLSPFAYNETMAAVYYPLSKSEVLRRGWGWREESASTAPTAAPLVDLPDTLAETDAAMLQRPLTCRQCQRAYKVIGQELAFYQKYQFPVPHFCPDCRFAERLRLRNPRKLWPRQCDCNRAHDSHPAAGPQCSVHFQTPLQPDAARQVYCETCYQKEIY